ncbi:hypothetical protein Q9L42_006120 [Methylomarinum sp. Ch1-1]|uniref:Lipoprotein n=1 Tax=Methylomarinum roseum TaxID=3067653 RepID=A0AAU7NXG9_9GAMM|nr:hypothetical protein [Methylomarinum sp. Ch1-1]MDP4522207.1 hypothetical protein [Methylomarinum sp. Ch1-1]
MKKTNLTIKMFVALAAVFVFAGALSGCSEDKPKVVAKKAEHNPFDHSHGADVTDLVKHKFEHDFAEQCVEREIKNSVNKTEDRKRYAKPCLCIATYMMKDLTAVEAEKFLQEHKDTQSLRIRFENAAYHCLQQKSQPKSPQLFGKR